MNTALAGLSKASGMKVGSKVEQMKTTAGSANAKELRKRQQGSARAHWTALAIVALLLSWPVIAHAAEAAQESAAPAGTSPEAPAPDETLVGTPAASITPANKPEALPFNLDYEAPNASHAPSTWALLGRLTGSLAIVVGLIFVSAFVFKRFLSAARKNAPNANMIEVIQSTPLGGKRQIYLVKVAGRVLVVGAGGDNMSLLAELPGDTPAGDADAPPETAGAPLQAAADGLVAVPVEAKRSEFFKLLKSVSRQVATGGVSSK